jgi:heme/copper-type cytochrome/quinol oxidase subunit 4
MRKEGIWVVAGDSLNQEASMSSFQAYLFGFIVLIIGLGAAAYLLGVSPVWIAVGIVILIGIAIISASSYMDNRPPPR